MTTPSPPLVASRLEKAATDNGSDVTLGREGDWLAFASSQTSLRLWLATYGALVLSGALDAEARRLLGLDPSKAGRTFGARGRLGMPSAARG